jgi:DNA-binding MarR family transcriptional regulator
MARGYAKAIERRRRMKRIIGRVAISAELHHVMVAHRLPWLRWPVMAEILVTTDYQNGLSRATARSIGKCLGVDHSTVYRSVLKPLIAAGFVQTARDERVRGEWPRVLDKDGNPYLDAS